MDWLGGLKRESKAWLRREPATSGYGQQHSGRKRGCATPPIKEGHGASEQMDSWAAWRNQPVADVLTCAHTGDCTVCVERKQGRHACARLSLSLVCWLRRGDG